MWAHFQLHLVFDDDDVVLNLGAIHVWHYAHYAHYHAHSLYLYYAHSLYLGNHDGVHLVYPVYLVYLVYLVNVDHVIDRALFFVLDANTAPDHELHLHLAAVVQQDHYVLVINQGNDELGLRRHHHDLDTGFHIQHQPRVSRGCSRGAPGQLDGCTAGSGFRCRCLAIMIFAQILASTTTASRKIIGRE